MDDIVIARALHVLAVVHWIGGVAFVTLIVLRLWMGIDIPHPDSALCVSRPVTSAESTATSSAASFPT
jgi:hypothetical protein